MDSTSAGPARNGAPRRHCFPAFTDDELAGPLSGYPPILTLTEAARLLRESPSTLARHVRQGRYRDAVKPGKPLLFWRDRLVRARFRNR